MTDTSGTEQTKSYWKKPNNYIRILTLVAVATYTAVQIHQTDLLQRANVANFAAFVSPANAVAFMANNAEHRGTRLLVVRVPFINSGGTRTKNLSFQVTCQAETHKYEEPWVLLQPKQAVHVPQVLGPHASGGTSCTFSPEELSAAAEGSGHLYIIGDVDYWDVIDPTIEHRTEFSWEFINPILVLGTDGLTGTFMSRGVHNCADEECPKD